MNHKFSKCLKLNFSAVNPKLIVVCFVLQLEGCQHACKFMQETSTSSSTTATEAKIVSSSVLPQKGGELKLAEPKVTKKGVVISWTMSQAKLTYAVLGLTRFHDTSVAAWEEIQQTTEHRLILHLGAKYDEILVAAYDSNGLVQKDSKKLVFQLRVKRSVEKSTSLDDNVNEYPLTSPSMFTLFLVTCIVTSCIASAVLIVKYLRNTSKNSIDPVVWV